MIWRFLANVAGLALATWLVPGIRLESDTPVRKVLTLAGVAVVFGVLNLVIKPIFQLFGSCLILLTLGLFLLVIDAAMLKVTSSASEAMGLPWRVDSWWAAFFGALIVSITSSAVDRALARHTHPSVPRTQPPARP